jgi:hydrogenase nickel incorporation protein HypB
MCATCGCSPTLSHDHDHDHSHDHGPGHAHEHTHTCATDATTETLTLEQQVLARNDLGAARNRGWFEGRDILALNLMSSPGAGKTTLLVRTITDLGGRREVAVIEGDQETELDAQRIQATGVGVVQVNTGSGCHLDAEMVRRALEALRPSPGSLVLVENVGNLVCPALFDLGEAERVVVMSVTEGDDKPLKYPHMFRTADVLVLNKVDLLPYVEFDVERCTADARRLKPGLDVLTVSATRGDGLEDWYDWLDVRGGSRRLQPVRH